MRVIVLGAGVIGTATAYWLVRDGHEVTVLDRQPGAGLETSFANGGQISASHAEPWANPATPAKVLRWLGRKDAPLLWRWRLDPALWAWGLRFLANCTPGRTRINTERTLRIALYSRTLLKALRAETGIEYDQRSEGILHLYRDGREFDLAVKAAAAMRAMGLERRVLDPAACVRLEPALAQAKLIGGIHSPEDESGDAHLFTQRLAVLAQERGATFRYATRIEAIETEAGRLCAIRTDQGRLACQTAVLALGSFSTGLAKSLGFTLPVVPAKGYSVTLPAGPGAPKMSLTDDELKMVYSRLGERLRIAGTAEFAGLDAAIDPLRARLLLDRALGLLPQAGDPAKAQYWAGLRPVTPDSVPILGPSPIAGLFLATGHGTLGWTMSVGTGRFMADLVGGKRPEIDPKGLGIDRFG
ncbi:MAG: D-amino acid dehydrogenase [Rhodospirillales bacterium]|nr:D-amino acid dehydrogenase [Rhodospirillales bacterium]